MFLGEGLINAGRIYGTLDDVPNSKCIEYPICENLIAGSAIGLALAGFKPIVVFQRMDFMLIASDAILNHMWLMPYMCGGQFTLPIIIRAIIGSHDMKFDVGLQHKQDYTDIFEHRIHTFVADKDTITKCYQTAWKRKDTTLIIEIRDDYERE